MRADLAGYNLRLQRVFERVKGFGRHPVTQRQVRFVIEAFRDELLADVKKNKRALWPTVGVFKIGTRKAHWIRNPHPAPGDPTLMRLPKGWKLVLRSSKCQRGSGDGP